MTEKFPTEKFTASNGVSVDINENNSILFDGARGSSPVWFSPGEIDALREYFQHERDEQLGRWRDPEHPDYVVYAWTADPARRDVRGVTVLSEAIPRGYTVWEDNTDTMYGTSTDEEARKSARAAAREYFEAHPTRKPWHDAQEGEVWVLTTPAGEMPMIFQADAFRDCGGSWPKDHPDITSARRIYPENESCPPPPTTSMR